MMEKKDIPDVSGFRLEHAIRILSSHGAYRISIRATSPPRLRSAGYDGNSRVMRGRLCENNTVELLVSNVNTL